MADLDPQGRERFDERERAIWNSTYAAAFVVEFERVVTLAGFDRAVRATTAERASHVADQAVREFRRWKLQEAHQLGDSFWTVD